MQTLRQSQSIWYEKSWPAFCSTLASLTQWTMTVNNGFEALHSVHNSWQHWLWDDLMPKLNRRLY